MTTKERAQKLAYAHGVLATAAEAYASSSKNQWRLTELATAAVDYVLAVQSAGRRGSADE